MIYKLVNKGAVEKRVSPDSDTEVVLSLTETGKINYQAHRDYHRQSNDDFFVMLKDMSEPAYEEMLQVLMAFEQSIDKNLDKG